jgi:serine/threonine protein kinase/tetratricopeptide (TPR) repeat protein
MSTPEPRRCPVCNAALPADLPLSLCPRCVFGDESEPVAHLSLPRDFADYELLEEIARGGMGVVYKARQKSLDRLVAVKMILFGPHAGTDFLRRFKSEALTAAALQHPNIVAVHEVGVHDNEHFIVMDYVSGPNLSRATRDCPLHARDSARCMEIVARAIHYAHERGVLHRDLKPSNILLDPEGQPRVTDFGLAKRFEVSNADALASPAAAAEVTPANYVIGSPGYMPPEQMRDLRGVNDRRSDVYSLGATLYHLLAGRPPFTARSIPETLQQLESSEPVSPRALNPSVPIDLETICLKCLEKDPMRRYPTAAELAEELARFQRGEPIHARPVNKAEAFWRWCKRKPAIASLSGTIALLLVGGTVVSTALAIKAHRAAREARTEAIGSDEVQSFLGRMLAGVRPSIARGRDVTVLREMLSNAVERLDSPDLKNQPRAQATLHRTIGQVFNEMGEFAAAERSMQRALAIERQIHGSNHLHVAETLVSLASVAQGQARFDVAEKLLREAQRIESAWFKRSHGQTRTLQMLSETLAESGKLKEAEAMTREMIDHYTKIGTNKTALAFWKQGLGNLLLRRQQWPAAEDELRQSIAIDPGSGKRTRRTALAMALINQGKTNEVEALVTEELAEQEQEFGQNSLEVSSTLQNYAVFLAKSPHPERFEPLLQRAITIRESFLGTNHPAVASTYRQLGVLLFMQRRIDDAERALVRAVDILEKQPPSSSQAQLAEILNTLSHVYMAKKQFPRAEDAWRRAISMRKAAFGPCDEDVLEWSYELGKALLAQKKWKEAEALSREMLRAQMQRSSVHPDTPTTLGNLGLVLATQGKPDEAEEQLRRAIEMDRTLHGSNTTNSVEHHVQLGAMLINTGQTNQAATIAINAWTLLKQFPDVEEQTFIQAVQLNGMLVSRSGDRDKAEALIREGLELARKRTVKRLSLEEEILRGLILFLTREKSLESADYAKLEPIVLEYTTLICSDPDVVPDDKRDKMKRMASFYVDWAVAAPGTGKIKKSAEWEEALRRFDQTNNTPAELRRMSIAPQATEK